MGLFSLGQYKLHSGSFSPWKIDCDVFTDKDIECIADLIAERVTPFSYVVGIPRGGSRLADALRQHGQDVPSTLLIVDDVLTTGKSMEEFRLQMAKDTEMYIKGAVIFARGKCSDWITPLWKLTDV